MSLMTKPHVDDVTVGFSGIDPSTDLASEEAQQIIKGQIQTELESEEVQSLITQKVQEVGGGGGTVSFNSDEAKQAIATGITNFFNGNSVVLDCGVNA